MAHRSDVRFSVALVGLLALAAACGGSNPGTPGNTGTPSTGTPSTGIPSTGTPTDTSYGAPAQPGGSQPQSPTLMVATDARLGDHVVDGSGRSLYYFAKDVPAGGGQSAISNCNAGCLPIWPIFDAGGVVATGIDATDVGQITRSDGSKQTTYKGFPLYYYAGDTAAGDTHGEGLSGIWYVVHVPAYSVAVLSKTNETATYLIDGAGRSLYSFSQDTVGTATTAPVTACLSASCKATWSIFLDERPTVPSGLVAADFTVYTRGDGVQQSAYKGHPLYRYVGDTAPGETNGRAVSGWHTIDPTGP